MDDTEREKRIEALLLSEPAAARVSPQLIEEMLHGFELPRAKDAEWFVERLRPLVWVMARQRLSVGNAQIRDELLSLAGKLRDLFFECKTFARGSDELLWLAKELEGHKDRSWERRLADAYYNPESLVHLAQFYEEAAARFDEKKQPPKWRAKERRKWRVKIALNLMPVFERGFGRKATINKWPSARHAKTLGHWADFYQRFMATTLGEAATPDLEGVLTEARKELSASGYSPGDFLVE